MKILILLLLEAVGVATVFSQGTVRFDNNVPGAVVTHVYFPVGADWGTQRYGNGTTDYPPGSTDWSGTMPVGPGQWFSAQLWAAPTTEGVLQPVSALLPSPSVTRFQGEEGPGFLIPTIATLAGVPADAGVATLQLRVWDNGIGSAPTWETAVAQGCLSGVSPLFNVAAIGGNEKPPPALEGLVSFSLAITIPEPLTVSLLILASGALLLERRRGREQI